MCNPYPGTRCSTDTRARVIAYEEKLKDAKAKFGEGTHEYNKVASKLEVLRKEYDATEQGMKDLKHLIETDTNVREYRIRLEEAERTYAMQKNALHEIQNGRQALIAKISPNPDNFFEPEEMLTIAEASREFNERMAHRYGTEVKPASANAYNKFLDNAEANLRSQYGDNIPKEKLDALLQLRGMEAPDNVNLKAYDTMETNVSRAKEALKTQIDAAAALQNVDPATAAAFYEGYREQYKKKFANLPPAERPDPPTAWVRGDFGQSGYTKDFDSSFAPRDDASLYAIYRLRSDANAIPEKYKTYKDIASIDLETSGPEGKAGLDPKNGRIIEVGIINYDGKTGKEKSRYSQLIKPEHLFLQKHGTGAEDVHKISVDDLKDSPAWEMVKDEVTNELKGKILLAQNSRFEKGWLSHHGDNMVINSLPIVDTLDISRKHLNLPNNKLQTICNEVGVAYTDGHRATHDALVTGQAYFRLRKHVNRQWRKKASRAAAPALTNLPKVKRFI